MQGQIYPYLGDSLFLYVENNPSLDQINPFGQIYECVFAAAADTNIKTASHFEKSLLSQASNLKPLSRDIDILNDLSDQSTRIHPFDLMAANQTAQHYFSKENKGHFTHYAEANVHFPSSIYSTGSCSQSGLPEECTYVCKHILSHSYFTFQKPQVYGYEISYVKWPLGLQVVIVTFWQE